MQRWASPDIVSDGEILTQFMKSDEVLFSARRFNSIKYRKVAFGDLGWWLPLKRVLPIIGITPEMLLPVYGYSTQEALTRKEIPSTPLRRRLENLGYPERDDDSMYHVTRYSQLGGFPLASDFFERLSKILGKSLKVMREDGGSGEHIHIFTVFPSAPMIVAV